MKNRILLMASALILAISLNAQECNRANHKGANVEEIRTERAEYFVKAMELTDAEKATFIPLLNEYMASKYQNYKDYRALSDTFKGKENRTDADCNQKIDDYLAYKQKRVDEEVAFYTKIRAILPAQKVAIYKQIEHKFSHKMMKKHDGRKGERGNRSSRRGNK